jgi:hypothetical protein
MLESFDRDYFQMKGFGRRMEIPKSLDLKRANEIKDQIKERVNELWKEHNHTLSKNVDMELLL